MGNKIDCDTEKLIKNAEDDAKKLLKVVLNELKDNDRGVYIGVTQNYEQRMKAHKKKNYTSSNILMHCKNISQAASIEYCILKLLSKSISQKRIDNRAPGGAFPPPKHEKTAVIYVLYFENYIKKAKKHELTDFSSTEFLDKSLGIVFKRNEYQGFEFPLINSQLHKRSVFELLGIKLRNSKKKRKEKQKNALNVTNSFLKNHSTITIKLFIA